MKYEHHVCIFVVVNCLLHIRSSCLHLRASWYFYDLVRWKRGMKVDIRTVFLFFLFGGDGKYCLSTMIFVTAVPRGRAQRVKEEERGMKGIKKEEQTYEKKINNKCAVRGMNTINCWIWQTSCTIHHWKMCMCGTVAFQTEKELRCLLWWQWWWCCCCCYCCYCLTCIIHFSDSYFSVAHSLTDHNGGCVCVCMWIIHNRNKKRQTSIYMYIYICMQKRGHLNICADKSNELKETAYLSCEYWIGLWNDCAVLLLLYHNGGMFLCISHIWAYESILYLPQLRRCSKPDHVYKITTPICIIVRLHCH